LNKDKEDNAYISRINVLKWIFYPICAYITIRR